MLIIENATLESPVWSQVTADIRNSLVKTTALVS